MRFMICAFMLMVTGVATAEAQPPGDWATVKGQVVLPAAMPIPARKPLAANAQGCPKGLLDESLIVNPKNRGIKNVIVWLRPAAKDPRAVFGPKELHPADAKRTPKDVVIDQPCCAFEPHVVAARVGDTVVVKNSADIIHNFFWSSSNNGDLNVNVPAKGQHRFPKPLVAESTSIPFKCTVHPWMGGHVRVFDHPYFAVTDDDGRFEIRNAPAGNYRIVYWHEREGFKGGKDGRFGDAITIAAGPGGLMLLKPTDLK